MNLSVRVFRKGFFMVKQVITSLFVFLLSNTFSLSFVYKKTVKFLLSFIFIFFISHLVTGLSLILIFKTKLSLFQKNCLLFSRFFVVQEGPFWFFVRGKPQNPLLGGLYNRSGDHFKEVFFICLFSNLVLTSILIFLIGDGCFKIPFLFLGVDKNSICLNGTNYLSSSG